MSRVFSKGPEDLCSIQGRVIPKTQKLYMLPPSLTLSIIREKWRNPRNGVASPLQFVVVAIEKGAFVLPSAKEYIHIYIYIYLLTYYLPAFTVNREKEKKTPVSRDDNISNYRQEEKEKNIS